MPNHSDSRYSLLAADEPAPVELLRAAGGSPLFFTCEHAGRALPARVGDLGLSALDLERHIAWDIGAAGVTRGLSERLDATAVLQRYSRLVVDCNRAPSAHDFIAVHSETTAIHANRDLDPAEVAARTREIFTPYHDAIRTALDARESAGQPTVLVAVHSCTPVYHGVWRPWHVGVLYDLDDRFARIVLDLLSEHGELTVGENEPYELTHERDYSVPLHGEQRGIPHVELEIRQDLIESRDGQDEWAERLAVVLSEGVDRLRALHGL
ncbi:N-formylglutamate amidohydrolase [Haliangium sp.]|uniref:N-formylglutamate amidohydrolase n=1 Tax=Haliangium sp. TaxID=2663208 RepID=UPI003D10C2E0